jgi:hypothetical protein
MTDDEELGKIIIGTAIAAGVALIGMLGMAFTNLYCFVPLTAIGFCIALPLWIWSFIGLLFSKGGKNGRV